MNCPNTLKKVISQIRHAFRPQGSHTPCEGYEPRYEPLQGKTVTFLAPGFKHTVLGVMNLWGAHGPRRGSGTLQKKIRPGSGNSTHEKRSNLKRYEPLEGVKPFSAVGEVVGVVAAIAIALLSPPAECLFERDLVMLRFL